MKKPIFQFRIGMRTIKTAAAVILSMIIVEILGTTDSRLIFAMLGATAAMQPTFRESIESCLAQIVGVLFGAAAGLFLRHLPFLTVVNTGMGIVLVIVLYNSFHIRLSPSMPMFMVVLLCTTPDISAKTYALGRIWDSAIGLAVGLLINTLVFPYDNSRQIRATIRSLNEEVVAFLQDMFDGDGSLPDAEEVERKIGDMERQLKIFSDQRLLLKRRRQRRELETFGLCGQKAKLLVAQMEVLSHIGEPGALSEKNRLRLEACGADIPAGTRRACTPQLNAVTNYHVEQILNLRDDLLAALSE